MKVWSAGPWETHIKPTRDGNVWVTVLRNGMGAGGPSYWCTPTGPTWWKPWTWIFPGGAPSLNRHPRKAIRKCIAWCQKRNAKVERAEDAVKSEAHLMEAKQEIDAYIGGAA